MTQYVTSALNAVAGIQSNHNVWVHSMAATPWVLLDALAEHALQHSNIALYQLHLEHAEGLARAVDGGHIAPKAYFASQYNRQLIQEGKADYIPISLSEIPRLFRRGEQRIDVVLIQVAPPDKHGICSLGVSVEATRAACEVADLVIAHINPQMPRTHGDAFIHLNQIDVAYEQDLPLPEHSPSILSEVNRQIGEQVASLIENGDCLQMGIGDIPDATLACLDQHQHLGIHTEMFSDGVIPLCEAGVIDNSRKRKHRGKLVTGFVLGSRKLYEFVDDNSEVAFLDIEYINSIETICRNPNMVSINSALQVDLSGQVCSDSLGTHIYSGVGGQLDFVLGSSLSEHGRSILAFPSTAASGKYSRIVPVLALGSGVVTPRGSVHHVVTEFGVANLRGKSLRERARALIGIAHPDFRETLSRQAYEHWHLNI
ncbi:acetyl-CoA hydrolase/transferase family protein [Ketobacter alkanivorans]|uniref:4-hydroxybutyrate CoA-transferase n=1 Tax=Ketobacter alkanivorans TaxID=1917421 RepID=A0A2K9LJ31_9GAMM|nr:acetyl-CoA hydrolase/transferase C-terminal domain-containing protein [Ketobacter alkanivorans]AUM12338.1 4-hydroxybutyrate CoA-transferase [Ketobacter alkanivorans]MCP5017290.1 acetyl-CoA hydrolase/transferase family protein [Ketobacter sp.]